VFEFSRFATRSVVLQLMYVGWSYHGFARQADSENTIEVCVTTQLPACPSSL
jgi:tRNA pseudouridine38/39 synthase